MRTDFNSALFKLLTSKSILILGLSLWVSGSAFALKSGHGSVLSEAGAPLQITIPLMDMSKQESDTIAVRVAGPEAWSKLGLTPPVALESMKVNVVPGFTPGAKRILVTSTQTANRSPVDIVLEVTTAVGSSQIQSSYLVLLPSVASKGSTVTVKRGDTLHGIATDHAVPGADDLQMLWALYQANPDAFIYKNMNLLRTGAVISIPDADTVRAVDIAIARREYQKHLEAFNKFKRGNHAAVQTSSSSSETQTRQAGASAGAEQKPVTKPVDQVVLKSNNVLDQSEDQKASAAKEIAELEDRIKSLQQNVTQLKDAAGSAATGSSAATVAAAASGASNVSNSNAAAATGTSPNSTGSATSSQSTLLSKSPALSEGWNTLTTYLAEHIMYVLAAVLAMGALVIAWMMRRAGERQDDESEEVHVASTLPSAAQSAFEQKLETIDLNLEPVLHSEKPSLETPPVQVTVNKPAA